MKLTLWIYSGGWLFCPQKDESLEVRLRVEPRESGRLEVVDLWLSREGGISVSAVRSVPLAKIEAFVNTPHVRDQILAKMEQPWTLPKKEMVKLRNRIASTAPADLDLSVWPLPFADLRIPTSRKKPDEFYRQVAEAYQQLAGLDRRPAVILAERNNVPVTTVHRWVKEARARGFLAPGRRLERRRQGGTESPAE